MEELFGLLGSGGYLGVTLAVIWRFLCAGRLSSVENREATMPGRQVLVVEDEPEVLETWMEALEGEGYLPIGFSGATEAFARLPELAPDLVLLDMAMPGMDGFEFLARLRASSPCADVPVLIVSGLGDALGEAIDPRGATTLGLAGILTKPVRPMTLLDHVRRIFGPAQPSTRPQRTDR